MKVYHEIELKDFEFWSGAKDTAALLTDEEFDMIESSFFADDTYYSETDVNDFFWFEDDEIARVCGYFDMDDMMEDRK